MALRYINWNIKCYCNIDKICEYLSKIISKETCVVALQEVMQNRFDKLFDYFSSNFNLIYSITYRKPDDEFDTDNRRLGVVLMISKDMKILNEGVFARCLFPERTLYATINFGEEIFKIATFHSVTGVSFKMSKAVQFRNFAESIRDYGPDIISLDANEPKQDHYDINQMKFFDQGDGGKGAQVFFGQIQKNNMRDAFIDNYDISKYVDGQPLTVSHILPNQEKRRYDFVFINSRLSIMSIEYRYEEACEATSDHAVIITDIV